MEIDSRELRDAFKHIRYYDDKHIYIDTITGKKLTSVTQLLGKYRQKFASDSISKAIAKRDGRKQSEILQEWEMKRRLGSYRGSLLHDYLENLWKGKIYKSDRPLDVVAMLKKYKLKDEFNRSLDILEGMANRFVKDHSHYYPISLELVVGNSCLAGQMDLLAWDDKKKCVILVDYKTDKKLLNYSEYGKDFLDPISHLEDCEINKYSLQLSLYKNLLEQNTSLKIKRLEVIWFNYKNLEYEIIPMKFLKKESQALMSSFSTSKTLQKKVA